MKYAARFALLLFSALPAVAYAQGAGPIASQIPEPGMLILFGMGAAALGLRMGRKRP